MRIVNKNIQRFEPGKQYIFIADKLQVRSVNKWADIIDGQPVNVKMADFGHITMNRPDREPKEITILPKFCFEVLI